MVVEDEAFMADALSSGLRRLGWAVDVAADGDAAVEKAAVVAYDLVLLDRDLPVLHGDDVCEYIVRTQPATKILMLTAAGSVDERIDGLRRGADDYLPKPFAFAELVERVRALHRRSPERAAEVIVVADLSIDTTSRRVWRGEREVALTKKEFGVLECLAKRAGRVTSAEELLDRVWDEHIDPFTTVVRVTMSTLRRKLGAPGLIETLPGEGYRL